MKTYTAVAIAAILGLGMCLALSISLTDDTGGQDTVTLNVFCAGSLLFPLESVEQAFEASHPGVDVQLEGHGSIQVVRHVTELGDEADVVLVADYSLIPLMMYDTSMPGTNESFADWHIKFAGNSIVLAYTGTSRYSAEINSSNWYEILNRTDVTFGFPNPLIDALGYRSLMVFQLAELYYDDEEIFDRLVANNFDPAFSSFYAGGEYVVVVPEVLSPAGEKVFLRASSIQLVPLLESGDLDYCFLYKSNAEQYGMDYLELPDELNLGSHQLQDFYRQVVVQFEHQRFSSIGVERDCRPIEYGLTIPGNAPNPDVAAEFVEFLLNGEGKEIFDSLSHHTYEPCLTDNLQALPQQLKSLVVEETT